MEREHGGVEQWKDRENATRTAEKWRERVLKKEKGRRGRGGATETEYKPLNIVRRH